MSIKIYNWDEWNELCKHYNVDPHEYGDFSIGGKQLSGGDTIDYEYIGDVPERED